MTKVQEPDFLKNMSGQDRWQWFDRQKEILAKAISDGATVDFKPELLQGFLYMQQVVDIKYCELVTMHNNAIVVAACSVIEKDADLSHEWILNLLDQADCAEWQMYERAQEFYHRNALGWPMTVSDHRKNMEKLNQVQKEDSEKFAKWFDQNVVPMLTAQEQSRD